MPLSQKSIEFAIKNALEDTKREVSDTCQSLEMEISSLFTSNGQTPFVTFNFGLGTGEWAREIQKGILRVRIGGLGKDRHTAVFPKLVFTLKEGVNLRKEDPNYDIKKLAIECSTKRIYPDILSYEKVMEIYGYFVSPMGCVRGQETVTYKYNGLKQSSSMSRMWNVLSEKHKAKVQSDGMSLYMDLGEEDLYVMDSSSGAKNWTKVRRMVLNKNMPWTRVSVKDDNGSERTLYCTNDHPLPVFSRGRTQVSDLRIGDQLYLTDGYMIPKDEKEHTEPSTSETEQAWLEGLFSFRGDFSTGAPKIELSVSGEKDLAEFFRNHIPGSHVKRHFVQDTLEVSFTDDRILSRLNTIFGDRNRYYRSLPEDLFDAPEKLRMAFLAGVIDGSCAITRKGRVSFICSNATLAHGVMRLSESLGLPAAFSVDSDKRSSYTVSFNIDGGIADFIVSKRKKKEAALVEPRRDKSDTVGSTCENVSGDSSHGGLRLAKIVSLESVDLHEDAYDLTTDSDFFDASGVLSHNCRSFLSRFDDKDGNPLSYGRRNIGVVTLNLPNIAMSVSSQEEFMSLLDERIQLVRKGILYRYNRLADTKASNAPILYMHGATSHRLGSSETVQHIFNNGEATASIGYIGLHEVATRFYGNEWQDNQEAKNFTLQIMERINYWKDVWRKEDGLGWSVYGTPAESLTDRFSRLDRETFGIVKDITDKEYYTNSFHLDVRKKVSPFEKIDFEKEYVPMSAGGNICYVEQSSLLKNPDAMETIWDYMHDRVPFAGVNTPVSECHQCGFKGDFDANAKGFFCPKCGNTNPDTMSVVMRMCGYLSNVSLRTPIKGRIMEMKSRVKHA